MWLGNRLVRNDIVQTLTASFEWNVAMFFNDRSFDGDNGDLRKRDRDK